MRLLKFSTHTDPTPRVGLLDGEHVIPLASGQDALTRILHADDVPREVRDRSGEAGPPLEVASVRIHARIDRQEVWGAGVTYERSKVARQEESEQGGSFYDLVYRAPRPELFFKATPSRVVGPDQAIRVRQDTKWCVPEPELALVVNP